MTKVEIRMMYLRTDVSMKPAKAFTRVGRASRIGLDSNQRREWAGSPVAIVERV